MAIRADQCDYKRGFQKHYHTYLNWVPQSSEVSRQLVLVYCVECGLKFLIMKNNNIYRVSDAQENLATMLYSHDFELLLREGRIGGYKFPQIETVYGDIVMPKTYHQLCRYSVSTKQDNVQHQRAYESQLKQIADLLSERI